MDYVVLNLYDGLMNFFDTEEEALQAAARDLEQYRHLGPWANCADDHEVLVMRVTRRLTATSVQPGGSNVFAIGQVHGMKR